MTTGESGCRIGKKLAPVFFPFLDFAKLFSEKLHDPNNPSDFQFSTRPVAIAVMSPWTDLALTGDSIVARATHDPLLARESLEGARHFYLGPMDAKDPRVSPLYGELTSLPSRPASRRRRRDPA